MLWWWFAMLLGTTSFLHQHSSGTTSGTSSMVVEAFSYHPTTTILHRKITSSSFSNSVGLRNTGPTRLGSTVVEEPVTIEDKKTTPDKEQAGTRLPAYILRLWNDPFNKREFVARCLAEVCGKSDTESFQIMMHAHQQGMGIIGQYDFEIAELYLESLKERGLMVDMVPVDDE
jgi:ATP-dependent Clp protease adapter protein ClpS